MALRDLAQLLPRPEGITCPDYVRASAGTKRCLHYHDNGTCGLPDGYMCTEWLKSNGHPHGPPATPHLRVATKEPDQPAHPAPARDLFGNVVEPSAAPPPAPPTPTVKPAPAVPPSLAIEELRGLTDADIASFRTRGLEVRLHSDAVGEIWFVPAYTGQDRTEITPEHAATILRVLSVFPGSVVTGFVKPSKTAPPAQGKDPS